MANSLRLAGFFLVLSSLLGWLGGCDSGNPMLPEPTNNPAPPTGGGQQSYALTLTLNPPQLEAASKTPGTLTVSAVDNLTNRSPANGTLVAVNTDKGNFGQSAAGVLTSVTLALQNGSANTSFFADTAVGQATLLAQLGTTLVQLKVPFVEPSSLYLQSLSPATGSAAGNEPVSLFGGGFVEPLTVEVGGAQATVLAVENGRINIRTPPSAVAVPAGGSLAVDVTVRAALDQAQPKTATLRGGFLYSSGAVPRVFLSAVVPATGGPTGGERVRVQGGGFASPLQVTFGGLAGLDPLRVSDGEITVQVPAPAAPVAAGARLAVDVVVRSGLDQELPQSATLPGGYAYVGGSVPELFQVVSLLPGEGPFEGGTEVTVTGTGFISPLSAFLAGVRQRDEVVDSSNRLRFKTQPIVVTACPADGRVGKVGLTLQTNTGAVASAPLPFAYTVPLPRITRISPTTGGQLGNTVVSVQGTSFADSSSNTGAVRAEFVIGATFYAGVVQTGGSTVLVRVASPRIPDSAFPEGDCTTSEGQPGKRYLQISAGVRVTNQNTGCVDTFGNSFVYTPSNTSCRPTGGS